MLSLAEKLQICVQTQPKSYGTRFLPHLQRALSVLRYNWVLYILHFSEVKEQNSDISSTVTAWLSKLLDFNFLVKCRLYEDLCYLLKNTSKVFQCEDARSLADVSWAFATLKMQQVTIFIHSI